MSVIGVVIASTSVFAFFAGIARIFLWPILQTYLQARITAGVDEAVRKRLAAFQLDLDKELEAHRNELGVAAEHIRASLARGTSDYAIYAQRRHDAVSNLYADFLRAEATTKNFRDLATESDPPDSRKEDMVARVIRARNEAYEAYYRNTLYLPDTLDQTATAVLDEFHKLLVEYVAPNDSPNVSRGRISTQLRFEMLNLQRLSREELARARPV